MMTQVEFRDCLLRNAIPVTRWIGRQHLPWVRHHQIDHADYLAIEALIKPGHILLSRRVGECNNFFIPGFWTHAALYAGSGQVIEAVGDGVVVTSLEEFCCGKHGKDFIMVRDPLFLTAAEKLDAIQFANIEVQAKALYDWVFTPNNKAFYCAELVWHCCDLAYRQTHQGEAAPFVLRQTLGVDTATAQDIAQAHDKMATVYVSDRESPSSKNA